VVEPLPPPQAGNTNAIQVNNNAFGLNINFLINRFILNLQNLFMKILTN